MTQVLSNTFRVEILSNVPAWFTGMSTSTWLQLANTSLSVINPESSATFNPNFPSNAPWHANEGQPAVIDDWCGAVTTTTSLAIVAQGGHGGYAGNEAYVLNLNAAVPAWSMPVRPSTSVQVSVDYYADGKPTSRHGEADQVWIPGTVTNGNRWVGGGYGRYDPSGGGAPSSLASYAIGSSAYDAAGFFPNFPGNGGQFVTMAYDPVGARAWKCEALNLASGGLYSFDPATKTWSARQGNYVVASSHPTAAIDYERRMFARLNGDGVVAAFDLTAPASGLFAPSRTGVSPPFSGGPGFVFHQPTHRFLSWFGGATVYALTPGANWKTDPWVWSTLTNAGGGATPTAANANGTYGRFGYISALNVLVVVNLTTGNAYVYKLP